MNWESAVIWLDGIIEKLRKRSNKVSEFWLKSIGKRLRKLKGMDPSDAAGIAAIRNDTTLIPDIMDAMEAAGRDTVQDAKALLQTAARLSADAAPVAKDLSMEEWISGLAEAAQGELRNIAHTTAVAVITPEGIVTPAEAYTHAVDEITAQLAGGEHGLRGAVRKVCEQFADAGLSVVEYESGRVEELGAATERNLKQTVHEVYQGVQRRVGQEYGADGVEISAHADCAPDHLECQGKQYTNEEYEAMNGALRRKIGTWNCRHVIYSIIVGITPPTYSDEELAAMKARSLEKVEFDGKEMTRYEATQVQRRLEREIRKQKNRSVIAAAADEKEMCQDAQRKINQLTDKYQELSDAFGIPTKADRMQVSGYRPVKVNSEKSVSSVDENNKLLHPTTESIQKAESFEDLQKILLRKHIGNEEPVTILDDSIRGYPLEIQKEIAEGIMWTRRDLRMKTNPELVKRINLPQGVFGQYDKMAEIIELKPNLQIKDAFTTAVHEMVHHSQRITHINCDKILQEACKAAGYKSRNDKNFKNAMLFIAGQESKSPDQVVAYAIEECSVGKGNSLAQEIYKLYRKESRGK